MALTAEQNREKHRNYMRRKYARDPEHRRKQKARVKVGKALKRGLLAKGPCKNCGGAATEAHHHDYDKPLDVEWLCKSCHDEVHGGPSRHG